MTTSVKVKVPEGANWDALVTISDRYKEQDGRVQVHKMEVRRIEPGQEYEVHITDTRSVAVQEEKRA